MLRLAVTLACLALTSSHAVHSFLPHTHYGLHTHTVPVAVSHYDLHHGIHSHGFFDHDFAGHHLYKRSPSPHIVPVAPLAPLSHGYVAHPAPIGHVAPVAVSHQSRVDVHHNHAVAPLAPLVATVPVAKTLVAPLAYPAPLLAGLHGAHGPYGAHGLHANGAFHNLGQY